MREPTAGVNVNCAAELQKELEKYVDALAIVDRIFLHCPGFNMFGLPKKAAGEPNFPFDHASIITTLQKLFELGSPMTPRVAAAPDLLCALTLATGKRRTGARRDPPQAALAARSLGACLPTP